MKLRYSFLLALCSVHITTQFVWSADQLGADIDGEADTEFSGRSVSLSADGSIVAIGADGNDGNGSLSGHVRIYEYNGSSWGQLGADIDGKAAGELSGGSVSLSANGSIVAIGARPKKSVNKIHFLKEKSGKTRQYWL